MTLRELLKVIDKDTRIQIRIRMYGTYFVSGTYNYIIENEIAEELLGKEVVRVDPVEENGIKAVRISLR
mgnify:CR=1 FL=1